MPQPLLQEILMNVLNSKKNFIHMSIDMKNSDLCLFLINLGLKAA